MSILVAYYSLYGNTFRIARAVADGARAAGGTEVVLARIPDFGSSALYEKDERVRNAQILQKEIPLAKVEALPSYRAIIFGSPSRYGSMSAPVRHFLDQTGVLWSKGALEGRFAGVFACSATPYSADDSALLSMIIPLLHLGMIVAGLPYSASARAAGRIPGSPYGVCVPVGPNSDRTPGETELQLGNMLGRRIAVLSRMPFHEPAGAGAETGGQR